MSKLLRPISTLLIVAALLAAGVYLGARSYLLPGPIADVLVGEETRALQEGLAKIESSYYREIGRGRLVNSSLDGAVKSLKDRFSAYFDPREYSLFIESSEGEFSGVGLSVEADPKGIKVVSVFPGSPAAKAGIKPGSVIVEVDGESVRGRPLQSSVAKVKGRAGTEVTLTVVKAGKRSVKKLKRARIEVPAVMSKLRTDGDSKFAHLRVTGFSVGVHGELRQAIGKALDRGAKGVVVDLRGNPGGLLSEAVSVASVFLPEGKVVVSTDGRNQPRQVLRSQGKPVKRSLPVVVLVDRDSASASEIVAAALRDYGRAKTIGTRTYGKGVFQQVDPLPNGGALDLTVGQYFTPKGKNLGDGVKPGSGIRPDIAAKDNPKTRRDEALAVALRTLSESVK